MKKKLKELLAYLSQQQYASTSTEIANALQISTRSVKNYVSEINALYNKKIIFSSRNGYELNHQVSCDLLLKKEEEILPQTSDERASYIVRQLVIEHTSHLDLFDLCEYLCVSYSTIKSDIAKMNKAFASYHVEFICEHDCVKVVGEEINKRKLISYIIYEEYHNSFIDTLQLKQSFSNIDIDVLYQIVTSTFKEYDYYLNDFVVVNMLLHLAIIIERELSGNPLINSEAAIVIEKESEQRFIHTLCEKLETTFQIHLNQHETYEIYLLFKANANYSLPTSRQELYQVVGEEIVRLTNQYVEQVNALYMIDLSNDAFQTPFCLHVSNLLFRSKMNRSINNPMAETIKLNSPIVFDIAIFISLDLMERYHIHINEDEIAFLAMHIGAEIERQNQNRSKVYSVLICPEYRDLSIQILNKLLLNFGNQITIVKSCHAEAELLSDDFQILFTTIPLHEKYEGKAIINISPFNISASYEVIQDTILMMQNQYKNNKLRTNFHTFFEHELFFVNPEAEHRDDILQLLCTQMRKKNYVHGSYHEKVLKREHAAPTAFGHIAIPHSMDMDALKTSIGVVISKKGIQWGMNTVHIVLLLAINKADKKTFRALYESLIQLFSEETMIQEMRNCNSFEAFEAMIYQSIDTEAACNAA